MAMNAPLQGTAADLVKIAMKRADDAIERAGLRSSVGLIMQVHDELIFEVDDGEVAEAVRAIAPAMEGVAKGTAGESIPLRVDAKSGKRWGSMTPIASE
jgi:DNA polymerase-1